MAPELGADANDRVRWRVEEAARRQDDQAETDKPRKDAEREMVANLVQPEATGFALGVASRRTQSSEVIVPVDLGRTVEAGNALVVGDAEQRMQSERRRAIRARQLLEDGLDVIGAHGFEGTAWGGFDVVEAGGFEG